jgi:hypothetical protein
LFPMGGAFFSGGRLPLGLSLFGVLSMPCSVLSEGRNLGV